MRKFILSVLFICGGLLLVSSPGMALTYSFYNITGNNATNATIGESQLFVDISSEGYFEFYNIGPDASSITGIYFDDNEENRILQSVEIGDFSAGVSFSLGSSPGELPGAKDVDPTFETTLTLLADSDPPVQPNGINPGEWLRINYVLDGDKTFNDLIAWLSSADLRIGIHVQGFELEDGSESFVNNPNPVPEPGTLLLLGSGLAGLAAARRRKRS